MSYQLFVTREIPENPKKGDVSSDSQGHIYTSCCVRKNESERSLGSLASQPNLLNNSQASKNPCLT